MICAACANAADLGQDHPCAALVSCTCQHGGRAMTAEVIMGMPIIVDPTVPPHTILIKAAGQPTRVQWAV